MSLNMITKEEYANLVHPLTEREYNSLRDSIKASRGNIVPIIINQYGVIIDGHHRYRICKELGFEPKIEVIHYENELKEIDDVYALNDKRRHLNEFQRIELALKKKSLYEKIAKEKQSRGGKEKVSQKSDEPPMRTDELIAKDACVSRDKVRKVEYILENGNEKDLAIARARRKSIHHVYDYLIKRERRRELLEQPFDDYNYYDSELVCVEADSGGLYVGVRKPKGLVLSEEQMADLKRQVNEEDEHNRSDYWWLSEEQRAQEIQRDKEYEDFKENIRLAGKELFEKCLVSKNEIMNYLSDVDESARYYVRLSFQGKFPPRKRPTPPPDKGYYTTP